MPGFRRRLSQERYVDRPFFPVIAGFAVHAPSRLAASGIQLSPGFCRLTDRWQVRAFVRLVPAPWATELRGRHGRTCFESGPAGRPGWRVLWAKRSNASQLNLGDFFRQRRRPEHRGASFAVSAVDANRYRLPR